MMNKKGQMGGPAFLIVGLLVAGILIAILGLSVGYPIVLRACNTTALTAAGASTTDTTIVTYIPTLYLVTLLMVEVGIIIASVYVGRHNM